MQHISQCESCWEAFMNIGVEEEPQEEVVTAQKRKLFSKITDPAYKGDHRMDQFQLLSSLHFTSYAKQVFLDYFTKLEEGRPEDKKPWAQALERLEDTLYEKLQKKKRERQDPDGPIDAEVMMGALDELGAPSSFLQSTTSSRSWVGSEPRRLYRSTQDKMIAGVCGGLAEHFRLDPILIRILFVGLLFFAGSAIFIYVALAFFVPVKAPPKPIFSQREVEAEECKSAAGETTQGKGSNIIRRLFLGAFTIVMFCCVYLPILGVLGTLSAVSAMSIFHFPGTISLSSSFKLTGPVNLSQLGLPGVMAGGSLALLFFSAFLLVLTFVFRLHFKKLLLGKSLQAVFVAFLVMSFFSSLVSIGVVFANHKESASKTLTRSFPLPKGARSLVFDQALFAPLKDSGIPLTSIKIQAKEGIEKIIVKVKLSARAETPSQAQNALRQLTAVWGQKKPSYLPSIRKGAGVYRFETANVTMMIPATYSLQLKESPFGVVLQGDYGKSLSINSTIGYIRLQQVKADKIQVVSRNGRVKATGVEGREINITTQDSRVRLKQLKAALIKLVHKKSQVNLVDVVGTRISIDLHGSKLRGNHIAGIFRIKNVQSRIKLKLSGISSQENLLINERGRTRLYFPPNQIPKLNVTKEAGRLRSKAIRNLPTVNALLSIRMNRGKIRLLTWEPSSLGESRAPQAPRPALRPKKRKAMVAPKPFIAPNKKAETPAKQATGARKKMVLPVAGKRAASPVPPKKAAPTTAPTLPSPTRTAPR